MKPATLASTATAVLLAALTIFAQEQARLKIGLLDLEAIGGNTDAAAAATATLGQLIAQEGMVEVYDQQMIGAALQKIGRQMPARCRDPRCVLDVGGMINLDRMIFGTIDVNGRRTGVHLYQMDIFMRQQIGETSIEAGSGVPLDTLLSSALARLNGRQAGAAPVKTYFGPEVHHEKEMLYVSGGFLAAGIVWGLVNSSVSNKPALLRYESRGEPLSHIPSSADQVPMFARPASLANAYVAASDDAYGVLYNPAGMAWLQGAEAIVGYQYRFGLNNIAISYVNRATRELGFGEAFLYSGDRDGLMSEMYFISAAAYKFNRLLSFVRPVSVGINLKIVSDRVKGSDSMSVSGASFGGGIDFGLLAELSDQIRYGLLLRDVPVLNRWKNASTGDAYTEGLATTLHMGGTYKAGYTTFLVCEGQIPLASDQSWKMAGGIEQELLRVMHLRLGVQRTIQKSVSIPQPWKLTCGFGICAVGVSLDGSYEYNTLGVFNVVNISCKVNL